MKTRILGTGSYVPEKILTNSDLEEMVETSDEWITTRTGISERRIVQNGQSSSDLGYIAAQRALEDSGVSADDLGLIVVTTITPDMFFPATACAIQHRLGAKNAGAFDLMAACSGFVYGVSVANDFVANNKRPALVIGAETLSTIIDWKDRNTCVLFGDGAGAAVVGPSNGSGEILMCELASDGSRGELMTLPAGGSRLPASHETIDARQHYINLRGREVFKFAVNRVRDQLEEAVKRCGFGLSDVKLVVPHQMNMRIIEAAMKRLDFPMEKVYVNIQKYGNTSAASIPIALDEAVKEGRLEEGDIVVLIAFGGGLTWASSVLRW